MATPIEESRDREGKAMLMFIVLGTTTSFDDDNSDAFGVLGSSIAY